MRIWFAIAALGALSMGVCKVQAKAVDEASTQERVDRLPPEYVGRWAIVGLEGEREVPNLSDCRRDEAASASLIVGSSWTLSPSGGTHFLSIYKLGDNDGYKIEVADNAGGELTVGLEIFQLTRNGERLEIASNPETGWDVTRYARCPAGEW